MIKSKNILNWMIFLSVFGFLFLTLESSSFAQTTEREDIVPLYSDGFGAEIVSSGNTVVVGSTGDDVGGFDRAGRVYIYEKDADGNLNLFDTLQHTNPSEGDLFGLNLAISGDYIVVGSSGGREDAFIYEKNAIGIWELVEVLTASDGAESSNFGSCVGVSGDTIIVGANWAEVNGRIRSGKAYIFERDSSGNWNETLLVRTRNPREDEWFGFSCAISDDYAIVGAPGWNEFRGYALIFERDESGNWAEVRRAIRRGADRELWDTFGWDVDIEGNIAIMGAPNAYKDPDDISGIIGIGTVFVYERDETARWRRSEIMVNDVFASNYGNAVDLSGDKLIVGAYGSPNENGSEGKAYTFERMARGVWEQKDIFISSDDRTNSLGSAVAIIDDLYLANARSSTVHSVHVFGTDFNALEMLDIDPIPVGGLVSELSAVGTTPNSEVVFIRGTRASAYSDNRVCPGLQAGIRRYSFAGPSVISDSTGQASTTFEMPERRAGRDHHFQAVDVATCTASNVVTDFIEPVPEGDLIFSEFTLVGASTYEASITNAAPGREIAIFQSPINGMGNDPSEVCENLDLDITIHIQHPSIFADETGEALFSFFSPASSPLPVYFQAVDVDTCRKSNLSDLVTD